MQICGLYFTSSRHLTNHRISLISVFTVFQLKKKKIRQLGTGSHDTQNQCTALRKNHAYTEAGHTDLHFIFYPKCPGQLKLQF